MGKLHSIRRAVERNPDAWRLWRFMAWGKETERPHIHGAEFYRGQWIPTPWRWKYRSYVKKVLRDLGYTVE